MCPTHHGQQCHNTVLWVPPKAWQASELLYDVIFPFEHALISSVYSQYWMTHPVPSTLDGLSYLWDPPQPFLTSLECLLTLCPSSHLGNIVTPVLSIPLLISQGVQWSLLLCQFKTIWLPRICQAFLPLFLENEREPDRETQWCWARWGGWNGAVNLNSANIAIALHVELCLAAHTACPLLWLGGQWVPVFLTKIYLDAGKIRVSTWRHWSSSIHCIFFSFDCNQCTQ